MKKIKEYFEELGLDMMDFWKKRPFWGSLAFFMAVIFLLALIA